jgi:DnaJ-domain-containing protein 1
VIERYPSNQNHPSDQGDVPVDSRSGDGVIQWVDRSEPRPEPTAWEDISRFRWQDVNDLYELLEVSPRASVEVIRKAYQALALKYHPDRQPEDRKDEAEKLMSKLNIARDTLLDPERRKAYDQKRKKEHQER